LAQVNFQSEPNKTFFVDFIYFFSKEDPRPLYNCGIATMYLARVCAEVQKAKKLTGEDLYKLNEAVFNLQGEERVDKNLAGKIFSCARKCVNNPAGHSDENYAYDLRAMLGTMQNQHFFTVKQSTELINWLNESGDQSHGQTKGEMEDTKALKKRVAELEKLLNAVQTVLSFSDPMQSPQKNEWNGGKNQDGTQEGQGRRNRRRGGGRGQSAGGQSSQAGQGGKGQGGGGKKQRNRRRRGQGVSTSPQPRQQWKVKDSN